MTQNAWMWRLYGLVGRCSPDAIIDSYEKTAAGKTTPPTLREIADEAIRISNERARTAAYIAEVAPPNVSGIAGYVEHLASNNPDNTLALGCIETMREILNRPEARTNDERNERLDKSLSAHEKIMSMAAKVRHHGQVKMCPVHDCGKPGRFAKTTHGDENTPYFCLDHFRNG